MVSKTEYKNVQEAILKTLGYVWFSENLKGNSREEDSMEK